MNTFDHFMGILPPAQRQLWPALYNAPLIGFTLYGGTAVALRLGHRSSVDFDFFSDQPLDKEKILAALPFIDRCETIQEQKNSWTVTWDSDGEGQVKVSFFGGFTFGRVGEPELTSDGVLQVASLRDLMATKLKVMMQRAEAKDYIDVAAMLNAGANLPHALASARLLYGPNFQPMASLKAFSYFGDGDLYTLPEAVKDTLTRAAEAVGDLPAAKLLSKSLGGDKERLLDVRNAIRNSRPSEPIASLPANRSLLQMFLSRQDIAKVGNSEFIPEDVKQTLAVNMAAHAAALQENEDSYFDVFWKEQFNMGRESAHDVLGSVLFERIEGQQKEAVSLLHEQLATATETQEFVVSPKESELSENLLNALRTMNPTVPFTEFHGRFMGPAEVGGQPQQAEPPQSTSPQLQPPRNNNTSASGLGCSC